MPKPAIILVSPQMGENIGATARAMSNFGFDELRVVTPRDGWPNPKAIDMAAHGAFVLEKTKVYEDVKSAVADLNYLIATTANTRDMVKPVYSPREATAKCNGKTGFMFGCERTGLSNEDLVMADSIISIPVSEMNPSLNLAQAVAVVCYEHMVSSYQGHKSEAIGANKQEVEHFFGHLEGLLDQGGFFKSKEMKPTMWRNIRNMFLKAELTSQDVRTLRGILKAIRE